jgi:hypothetical protein
MGASVTEQLSGRPGDRPSPLELEFGRRWRSMVDRVSGDGGQARVAESLKWTTSTASRDYNGETLPTDERLLQLCRALRLPTGKCSNCPPSSAALAPPVAIACAPSALSRPACSPMPLRPPGPGPP